MALACDLSLAACRVSASPSAETVRPECVLRVVLQIYWQSAPLLVWAIMSVLISDHESEKVDEGILRLLFFYFDITHNILYLLRILVQEEALLNGS